MSLVGLQGQGSFLARDAAASRPEEKGGLLSVLVSTQSRHLTVVAFNSVTGDFAVSDSHGQVFYFQMSSNSYQLVRLGGDSKIGSMSFLHSKLNYLALAYDDGSLVVVDLKKRKAVATMETLGGGVIRMLRCHPKHSLLVGLSVHSTGGRTLDLYDMKTMSVAGSMPVEEDVMDIKFASIKDAQGKHTTYIAVLLEVSGVMFYNVKDFSLAFSCPFPNSERMPKWTAFSILDTVDTTEEPDVVEDVAEALQEEEPAFRFVTAGANSSMYLWEAPTYDEIAEYAEDKAVGYCSIGAVVEMPVNVKTATYMQTLGDPSVNNETYRLHVVASSGAGLVIDISGLSQRGFGVKGMWTVVSDLSDSRAVGSVVERVTTGATTLKGLGHPAMGGSVIVSVPSTSDENSRPNTRKMEEAKQDRIDGFAAGSSYCYAVVCRDGALRLFDSDYGVGYGVNAGIVLACREVYGDETRVPIMRYTLANKGVPAYDPSSSTNKPAIEVKLQRGLRHGGAREAVQKEVRTRDAAAKGRANVEKAKEDKELENKKSNRATTERSRALRKAEESAKAAAKAKDAEKKMAAAQAAVRKAKVAEKTLNRRQGSRLSAAQEIEMANRAAAEEGEADTEGLDGHMRAAASFSKDGACLADMVYEVSAEKRITDAKLKSVLKVEGRFPERHRTLIWRVLLKLPENVDAFADLVRRGVHPAFKDLSERYPLRSRRIFWRLQNTCSQLAHWAPVLAKAPYLPQIVFPFVMVFGSDELAALEASMTVMMWWGHSWQVTQPNPPVHIMDACDALLHNLEPRVYNHLVDLGMSPAVLGWVMISSLFTEVLCRQDWLALMDFLLLHFRRVGSPLLVPVALVSALRNHILHCHSVEEAMQVLRTQQRLDMRLVLKTLGTLVTSTSPRYLAAMATGKAPGDDALSDDLSVGTRATRQSAATARSASSSRSASAHLAGYTYTEVDEALESIALSGGAPLFPLHKGRYPCYDILPDNVVDWQLRDRHRAIMQNQASGAAPSEDALAMLSSRLEQVQADHKDLMISEDRFAQSELARRRNHADVERLQLQELERIEKEISGARMEAAKRKEEAMEEGLQVIESGAAEAKALLDLSELQMQEKVQLQMKVASQREVAEKAELETQNKIEAMLSRRVREEVTIKMSSAVSNQEAEIEAKQRLLLEQNALQEEQIRTRAAERSRRVQQQKEALELAKSSEAVVGRMQELLLERESRFADIERERTVRFATESTLEGMSAAELAAGYLKDAEDAAVLTRQAELAQSRAKQVSGAYGTVLSDIRTDAEARRVQERQLALAQGRVRRGGPNADKAGGAADVTAAPLAATAPSVSGLSTSSHASSSSSSSSSSSGSSTDVASPDDSVDDILDPLGPTVKLQVRSRGGASASASATASAPPYPED